MAIVLLATVSARGARAAAGEVGDWVPQLPVHLALERSDQQDAMMTTIRRSTICKRVLRKCCERASRWAQRSHSPEWASSNVASQRRTTHSFAKGRRLAAGRCWL